MWPYDLCPKQSVNPNECLCQTWGNSLKALQRYHKTGMDGSICCWYQAIKMKIGRKFSVAHTHVHAHAHTHSVLESQNTQLQRHTHTTLCVNFTQTQLISPYNPVWVAITYNTNTGVCLHGNVKPTMKRGARCWGRGMRHCNPDHDIIAVFQLLTHWNETEIRMIETDSKTSARVSTTLNGFSPLHPNYNSTWHYLQHTAHSSLCKTQWSDR